MVTPEPCAVLFIKFNLSRDSKVGNRAMTPWSLSEQHCKPVGNDGAH